MKIKRFSELQKKSISVLIGIVLAFILLEILLRMFPVSEGLHLLAVNDQNPIMRFEENRDFIWSDEWNFSIVTTKHSNNYGFLNDQDYSKREDLTPLMVIIGDSYVEALQVENKLTMHGILAKEVSDNGKVYSFGVRGRPLSTYLAYAEYIHREFMPTSMVIIIVGNDFDESLSKYGKKPGAYQFSRVSNGELVLERFDFKVDLVKKFARRSALIRYLTLNLAIPGWTKKHLFGQVDDFGDLNTLAYVTPERISDSKRAVDEFFVLLPAYSNLSPENILFVIDGMRPQIYSDTELQKTQGSYYDIMRRYFITRALENGYEVIDMQPRFVKRNRADGSSFEFETDRHWNALAHKLVAEAIQSSNVFSDTFDIRR